jgi:Kef-type K+ transport system membrane component KefB
MAGFFSNMSRRSKAVLWLLIAAIVIGTFIVLEQIALLYVVATLGIVLLLLVVAFADLEKVGRTGGGGPSGT